jgi:23S rRNA-/tRNA-specific pseudouridylate synthase
METKIIIVTETDTNKRIDNFISEQTDLTRSRVQKLIEQGNIKINEKSQKVIAKQNLR